MLKQSESAQSMTIQSLDSLDTKSDTMQNDKNQQLTSKNGHISFSVASLLADTRPSSTNNSTPPPQNHSSDEEYDSNQEDSIVDVEDLNSDSKEEGSKEDLLQQRERDFAKEAVLSQGPIRPTPFSALAAAVYQAAHPNWSHQGLVNPFAGPGPMFQGPTPFGVPSLNSGKSGKRLESRTDDTRKCFCFGHVRTSRNRLLEVVEVDNLS